jgi:hypothetical protein
MPLFRRNKRKLADKAPAEGPHCADPGLAGGGRGLGAGLRGNSWAQDRLGQVQEQLAQVDTTQQSPSICDEEVAKPEPNGCGPANIRGGGWAGNKLFPLFGEACNTHDVGDGEVPGYATPGADKAEVDVQFLEDMIEICDDTYDTTDLGPLASIYANEDKRACYVKAQLAYLAVSQTEAGQSAFDDAQAKGEAYETYAETCLE